MKYIIIAALFLNPIIAESQKRKKKEDKVAPEPSASVLIDCNTVSPVFFLPEGATEAERFDAENAYKNLIELEFNAFPYMVVYQSTVEATQFKDNISKWIAESETNTLRYTKGAESAESIVLRDYLMNRLESSYDKDKFLTQRFGTLTKERFTVSTDTTGKPSLWYYNNRLFKETMLEIEPVFMDYDAIGNPIYSPEDVDAFGNPMSKQLNIYNMPESEIDLSKLGLIERFELLSNGILQKKIEGLVLLAPGPDHTNVTLPPIFLESNNSSNNQLYLSDVVSNLLFDFQGPGMFRFNLEKLTVTLLKLATKGMYDIYEASYDNEMNIAVLEHSISSGRLTALPSDQLFESDDDARKFLQTVFMYDSVPAPTSVDIYGMPIYDPKDIDAYGNPIVHLGKDIHNLTIDDIAGIQLLEDWYLNEDTGELSKRIKGFSLLSYNLGGDGETIHGVGHDLGRRFYFRMKE